MSYILTSTVQPTVGIQPRYLIVRCRNKEASTLNANILCLLDFAQASEEPGLGSSLPGTASNSKWANVALAATTTAATTSGLYGITQEAIAAGAEGLVMFAGFTNATSASLTYAVGNRIGLTGSAITAGNVSNATVTTPIGIATTAATTTSPRILLFGQFAFGA